MKITAKSVGDIAVIRCNENGMDEHSSPELMIHIEQTLLDTDKIVFDFSQVEYGSSDMLTCFIRTMRLSRHWFVPIITCANTIVNRVLTLTNPIGNIFRVHQEESAAIANFS